MNGVSSSHQFSFHSEATSGSLPNLFPPNSVVADITSHHGAANGSAKEGPLSGHPSLSLPQSQSQCQSHCDGHSHSQSHHSVPQSQPPTQSHPSHGGLPFPDAHFAQLQGKDQLPLLPLLAGDEDFLHGMLDAQHLGGANGPGFPLPQAAQPHSQSHIGLLPSLSGQSDSSGPGAPVGVGVGVGIGTPGPGLGGIQFEAAEECSQEQIFGQHMLLGGVVGGGGPALSAVNLIIDRKLSCELINKLFAHFPGMQEWSSQVLSQHLTTETLTTDESAARTFLEWFMKKYPNRMSHLEEFSQEILTIQAADPGMALFPMPLKPDEPLYVGNDIMMVDHNGEFLSGVHFEDLGVKQEVARQQEAMAKEDKGTTTALNLPPEINSAFMNGGVTTDASTTAGSDATTPPKTPQQNRRRVRKFKKTTRRKRKDKIVGTDASSSTTRSSKTRQSSLSLEHAVVTKSKRLRIRRGTNNKQFVMENDQEITYFGCSECDKKYTSRGALREHIQTVHEGQTPFVCEFCGKRFGRRNYLTIHLRIHTGERPYSCSECGKSFTQKGALKRHSRLHTGEKPFKCPFPGCDRSFSDSGNMRKHMKVHGK